MNYSQRIEEVCDKDGFLSVVRMLSQEFKDDTQKWQNKTIDEYLESIASWVEDFSNAPNNDVDWNSVDYSLILRMLFMGGIYE